MAVIEAPPRPRPSTPPTPPPPPEEDERVSRGLLWGGFGLMAVIALVLSLVAISVAATNDGGGKSSTAAAASTKPVATKSVDVTLGDLFIKPSAVDVQSGGKVRFVVTNTGAMEHDFQLEGGAQGTGKVAPGASKVVELGPFTSSTQAWCTVPGHKQAGMLMSINVAGTAAKAAASDGSMPGMQMGTAAASTTSQDAQIDFNATPGPDFKPFDPTLKPAEAATVHNVSFSAEDKVVEIAPGVKQQLWTFNGQTPGPILRGHVGDVFNVTLTNNGTMGHSIDFHAGKRAMNDVMRTLQPGESLVYQFKADYAGIWMYHCGTAPALDHIGNGMFGAVVIDPPNLAPVAHEYVMVQNEFYTGPQGQPGDYNKMQAFQPDAVVFNGYVNQYKFAPIKVGLHERVRVWVLDAGPSENSSFHIVGTVFDTMFKEGSYTLQPNSATKGGAQALDLEPAQGGFVEFSLDEPGNYAMVTHKFVNVGKGALGVFQAGDAGAPMSH